MKKLLLIIFLVNYMFALNSFSILSDHQKQVITTIIQDLGLPNNEYVKDIILNKIKPAIKDNWSAYWVTNQNPSNSKIQKSKTQFFDLNIYNDNRVFNYIFIYFKNKKQLFISIKQYVDTSSKNVISLYNKTKSNKNYSIGDETDKYAYFAKKGYMSYIGYHTNPPGGIIIYEDSFLFDIK